MPNSHQNRIEVDAWPVGAKRCFAHLLHSGPAVITRSNANTMRRYGLVCVGDDGSITPEAWAIAEWNIWKEERLRKATPPPPQRDRPKLIGMPFVVIS